MNPELQKSLQVSTLSNALDSYMLIILLIMIVAGVLGGIANFFLSDRGGDSGAREWGKYIILGVISALTVPLFLNMLSSNLLEAARTRVSEIDIDHLYLGLLAVGGQAARILGRHGVSLSTARRRVRESLTSDLDALGLAAARAMARPSTCSPTSTPRSRICAASRCWCRYWKWCSMADLPELSFSRMARMVFLLDAMRVKAARRAAPRSG